MVGDNPYQTLKSALHTLNTCHGIKLSLKALRRAFKMIGISRKRCSRVPHIVDTVATKSRKVQFCKDFLARKDDLYAVDETYFSEKVVPLYAYSLRGQKVHPARTGGWKQRTLILAVKCDGHCIWNILDGPCNTDHYVHFVKKLPDDAHILADNVSFHKSLASRTLFTPPYSPDLNPVEYIFSTIKSYYRGRLWTHKYNSLEERIGHSVDTALKDANMGAYFGHVAAICMQGLGDINTTPALVM
jgi:transposase